MRTTSVALQSLCVIVAATAVAAAQPPPPPEPAERVVAVRAGTRLAAIKELYDRRVAIRKAIERDAEDRAPLPRWFRSYLRDNIPDLPTSGTYQYPRVAVQLLEWMVAHPDLQVPPPTPRARRAAARVVSVGPNINITNLDERNSESAIAVDSSDPRYVIAGSNNITGSGRQKQFYSSDSGATWSQTELPLAPGRAFQSDPSVAFSTDGTAWAVTLGIDNLGTSVQVQIYKSTDHGASWTFQSTISTGNNNDKEMLWIDTHPTSPFKDNMYVAWDVPGNGIRFARSTDKGATWSAPQSLSTDQAIGVHLTTGPAGELYVAWPDTASRELRIRKSTDGGATFASVRTIAVTNDSYEIVVPAMCQRNILIYLSLGVDRSSGPRAGNVYAAWTDRNGTVADPGCTGTTSASNANVYLSASTDGGNTWSTPGLVHPDAATTDQFNQWMDVDPADGTIQVIYYDTGDDPGRKKTHLYYASSADGAATWGTPIRVTTAQTDETGAGADTGNQYGDYNGLAAYRSLAYPSWTDRRTGNPGGKEQIYTAALTSSLPFPPIRPCQRAGLCVPAVEMIPGGLTLECVRRPCLVIDPLPRNCLVKFDCPGCSPGGLCPPWYNLTIQELDPSWRVTLYGPKGATVSYRSRRTTGGYEISFRPSKAQFQDGKLGEYYLGFRLGAQGKTGTPHKVKMSLQTGDQPSVSAPPPKPPTP